MKTDLTQLRNDLVTKVRDQLPEALLWRQHLHMHPCLSGEEAPASQWIAQQLPEFTNVTAQTGRFGRIGPATGQAVALRAELDALPVKEQTGAAFQSLNAAMHACGHDVHLAALMAVVKAAREVDLPYSLVPFLQPREETYPSGAQDIMAEKVLQQQQVRAVFGAHVHPQIPAGEVAVGAGAVNAAADEVFVTVTGVAGHGAYPHKAVNPIGIVAQILQGVSQHLTQVLDPMTPYILTPGKIWGGASANVIPETAGFAATLRTMSNQQRQLAYTEITNYAQTIAGAAGAQADVTLTAGEPVLFNDPHYTDLVDEQLRAMGVAVAEPMRSLGADDFSFYGADFSALMAFVGVENSVPGQPSLHHPEFLPTDAAVFSVAQAYIAGYIAGCKIITAQESS